MSRRTLAAFALAVLVVVPTRAHAEVGGGSANAASGGTAYVTPPTPGTITPDGLAVAPGGAPPQVAAIIAWGNRIAKRPYRYGGGHRRFTDTAYDCSGSISYALRGAALLKAPLDSTAFMDWGDAGPGLWVSVYANRGHAYILVAGLRFDTSGRTTAGSRWQLAPRSAKGFAVRHPRGL
ncbi:MAG: peptidoglycan endopeptidase [Solirubrobacterales bacterium]|nr:peptidoglycan endopeptidase [Solirubrobacterales bacterium]